MRVILTENVEKLGQVGDVRVVAPGYGRNYLIPQGLAVLATPGALKQIDGLKRAEQRRQDAVRAEMTDFGARIARLRLTFKARVGETGRLYGSITSSDIAEAIESELGEEMDRRKILLEESIRTLGDHVVPIRLMPGVETHVSLEVMPEEDLEAPVPQPDLSGADPDGAADDDRMDDAVPDPGEGA